MGHQITHEQKELAIEAIRQYGTMKAGAEAANVTTRTLNNEMRRSVKFKERLLEAREEGNRNRADEHLQFVHDVAAGKIETKMPRLTAALSILNWIVPGFRGTSKLEGKIEHDIRVLTAVPRPKYDELPKVTITRPPPPKVDPRLVTYGEEAQKPHE